MSFPGWRPFLKQEQFLAMPLTVKEGFYAGAVNAGKSDVLLMYPIVHGWFRHPRFKGLFLRRTMPELRNEIIPRSKIYFEPLGGKYNTNDALWTFPSGALFFFGHCEKEDDVHKYDSMQPNYVAFDELTSFTEWQYLYIVLERVRRTIDLMELPAIARSGSNPGNIGHAWVRKRFIDPCPKGYKIITGRGGVKRMFIPATIADNPYADPEYLKSLDALPEAERQSKKFGSWSAYEGQVFSEFRDHKIISEPDNAIHMIESFKVPEYWPNIVVIDWGFAAMTYVGYGAISPKGRLYIYREQSFIQTKIEEWAAQIKPFIEKEEPKEIIICHSAAQDRGQPHTIQEQVTTALGRSLTLSERDRIGGKQLLHEYLRWKKVFTPDEVKEQFDTERASWLLRNKGLDYYKDYIRRFEVASEIEDNLPKLQIFSSCTLLRDAIKSCVYDKTRKEDVAEFPGDDPYDAVRYLVTAADRYFEESASAFRKVQQQEVLQQKLEQTQDWTAFYRGIKTEDEESQGPVRRYHAAQVVH